MLHWDRPAGGAEPTAVVVRRADGSEAFRLAPAPRTTYPPWSPVDDRIAYQVSQTVYIRNVDTGEESQFEAPDSAYVRSWIANGSKLVLEQESSTPTSAAMWYAYIADATSGATENIPLPGDAAIGPPAQWTSISPNGSYISYPVFRAYPQYDLLMTEIATGRTCLLLRDAPSHQYPEVVGWSPDGRWLTYATRYEFSPIGFMGIHVVDPKTCVDQAVGLEDAGDPTWSPLGSFLTIRIQGAAVDQFTFEIWRPNGVLVQDGLKHSPTWSPDETMFASVAADSVQVVEVDTGATTEYPVHNFSVAESTGLLWSPSGRYLLVYGHSATTLRSVAGAEMYVLDRQTGTVTTLVNEQREIVPTAWLP